MSNSKSFIFRSLVQMLLVFSPVAACTDTSDAEKRLDSLEERVSALEDIAGAVNKNSYAISILYKEGITIAGYELTSTGYKLVLSSGEELEITFGAGLAGTVPVVGVDSDGAWIVSLDAGASWTPIEGAANSRDGDGDIPLVQVDEYGFWQVSVDGGQNWDTLTDSTGRLISANDGRYVAGSYSFFTSVTYDDSSMRLHFELNNGDSFVVPVLDTYSIELKYYEEGESIFRGESLTFPVEINRIHSAVWKSVPEGWRAVFSDEGMTFTAPEEDDAGEKVFELLVFSNEGYTKIYTYRLQFYPNLIYFDDFDRAFPVEQNGKTYNAPDPRRWSFIPHNNSSTVSMFLSESYENSYVEPDMGRLMMTSFKDDEGYKTCGIFTENSIFFHNARVEVRAQLIKNAQGGQHAIWLNTQTLQWPEGGEIDIMEHINKETIAYQTAHTNYTIYDSQQPPITDPTRPDWFSAKRFPEQQGKPNYNPSEYHTFGVDITDDALIFHIDGKETFRYPNMHWMTEEDITGLSWKEFSNYYEINKDRSDEVIVRETLKKRWAEQWPFQKSDWYLEMNIALGSTWAGAIRDSELPCNMYVDWVRITPIDKVTPLE